MEEIKQMLPNLEIKGNNPLTAMVCSQCQSITPIFFIKCIECKSQMIPLELHEYYAFKPMIEKIIAKNLKIEELSDLTQAFANEYDNNKELKKFILLIQGYLHHFCIDRITSILGIYLKNLRTLLKFMYLYEFRKEIYTELNSIKSLIAKFKQDVQYFSPFGNFKEKDKNFPLIYIRVKGFMKFLSLKIVNTSNENNLNAIRAIHSLLFQGTCSLVQDLEKHIGVDGITEEGKESLDFKIVCLELRDSIQKEFIFLSFNPFLKVDDDVIHSILRNSQLELLFLPNHGQYCIIKKEYTPNLKKITSLIKEEGSLTLETLARAFKISVRKAEVIIQYLIRRKMGILTYSYLKGERFFSREGL